MGYMNKYEGFELSRRFPGDPPEYSVERVRRTFGADVPLITADISYPVFSAEEKTGLERINALYREMAERFLAWAENEGHEAALAAYESDPDPARRFRFRRFRICAIFEPGFCSPSFISVAGRVLATRGSRVVGGNVSAQNFRTSDGRLMPVCGRGGNGGGAICFTRDGKALHLEFTADGIKERCENIGDCLNENLMISKLFATIR